MCECNRSMCALCGLRGSVGGLCHHPVVCSYVRLVNHLTSGYPPHPHPPHSPSGVWHFLFTHISSSGVAGLRGCFMAIKLSAVFISAAAVVVRLRVTRCVAAWRRRACLRALSKAIVSFHFRVRPAAVRHRAVTAASHAISA